MEIAGCVDVVASDLYKPENVRDVTRRKGRVSGLTASYNEWPEKFPPLQKSILDGLTGNWASWGLIENIYMYGAMNSRAFFRHAASSARKGRVREEINLPFLRTTSGLLRVTRLARWKFLWSLGHRFDNGSTCLLSPSAWKACPVDQAIRSSSYVRQGFRRGACHSGRAGRSRWICLACAQRPAQMTQGELVRMFAEEAGLEPKMSSMGKLMMSIGGLFIPEAKETVEMMYEFENPCD